jgi:archaellum component FlaG (FlaF/FlaG flagellin family)
MATEQLQFTNYAWGTSNATYAMTVKNSGSSDLSIQEVRVDGNVIAADDVTPDPDTDYPLLTKGSLVTLNITLTGGYAHGVQYEFTVVTAKGNIFGPYIRTAP